MDAFLKAHTAFGLVLIAACFPAPADLVGKACDVTHPCPEELVCTSSVCEIATDGGLVDAGPITNLLDDADFEAGYFDTTWGTPNPGDHFQIQSVRVHSGNYAGQLTTADAGTAMVQSHTFSLHATSAGVHCARAWVTSDQETVPTLQLVRTLINGPPVASGTPPGSTTNLGGGTDWVQLQTSLSRQTTDLGFQVTIFTPLADGGSLYVDDVQVWLPASGACP